jgi:RND family efflux transporter MFP subunit
MKKLVLYLIIIGLVVWMGYRFVQTRAGSNVVTIQQIHAVQGYPVQVSRARLEAFQSSKHYVGTIVGGEEADAVPLLSEYIAKVSVREGESVKSGQVICELSKDNPSAGYQLARLALANAERDLNRVKTLFDQGAISRQALDGLQLSRDAAAQRVESSEKLLEITSPISGIVTELKAEVGKFANPGQPLAKIVSRENFRIRIDIPVPDRDLIPPNATCAVHSGSNRLAGRLERVALSADKETRCFSGWIRLDDRVTSPFFSPGILAEVDVTVADEASAVVIEADALIRSSAGWQVLVVENGRAYRRDVTFGGKEDGLVWVREGLDPGMTVVISGGGGLADSSMVRVIDAS